MQSTLELPGPIEAQEQQPASSFTPYPAAVVTPQNSSEALPTPVTSDQPPGHNEDSDGSADASNKADPGCLDDEQPENNNNGNYEQELEAIFKATPLDDLWVAVHFIQALQTASLDNKYT